MGSGHLSDGARRSFAASRRSIRVAIRCVKQGAASFLLSSSACFVRSDPWFFEPSSLLCWRFRPSEQRDRQVSAVLDRMFAYDQMAKRTLPDHWKDLSEGQQGEFTGLLKRIFQQSYEKRLVRIADHH